MTEHEKTIETLEAAFPETSGSAFAHAREEAFEAGLSVLQSEGGIIYKFLPDGTRHEIKHIEPPTVVKPGTKLRLE